MTMEVGVLPYLFGGFVVFVFCRDYFNKADFKLQASETTLKSNLQPKMLTYRYQYNLYALLFLVVMEVFYLLVASNLSYFLGKTVSLQNKMGVSAVSAALVVSGLLPRAKFVEPLMKRIRDFFYGLAEIPDKWKELCDMVKFQNPYEADSAKKSQKYKDFVVLVLSVFAIDFRQFGVCAISAGLGTAVGALTAFMVSVCAKYWLSGFVTLHGLSPDMQKILQAMTVDTSLLITWVVCSALFLMTPTLLVLVTKRYLSPLKNLWPLVTPQTPAHKGLFKRPWHVYLAVSMAAYPPSYFILCGIRYTKKQFNIDMLINNGHAPVIFAAFALVGVVTAFFVAFRIDSPVPRQDKGPFRAMKTLLGCLIQGAATMTTFYFVFMHTMNDHSLNFWLLETKEQSFLIVNLIVGLCSGAALFLTSRFNTEDYERRDYNEARTPCSKRVIVHIGTQVLKGTMRDHSQGGAHIYLDQALSSAAGLVMLEIHDRLHAMQAKVVDIVDRNLHLSFDTAKVLRLEHHDSNIGVLSAEEIKALHHPELLDQMPDCESGPTR